METGSNKGLNKEFLDYYLNSSLPSMRSGLFFTFGLFLVFALLNHFLFPDTPERVYYIRFGAIVPFLLISVLVMYIPAFRNRLHYTYVIINLFICLVIFVVGVTSSPDQEGYQYYYAWVMLVIIGFYTFYRLQFRTLIIIGGMQLFAYILATLINGTFRSDHYLFINDLFFVISMSSLGFFMTYIIEKLNWKNFLHQKAVSDNYKKLLFEMKERKEVEAALLRSESLYQNTLNSIPDWIYVIDEDLRFVMLNASLRNEHLRQGFPLDCIGKKINRVYPYISSTTLEELNFVFRTGEILIGEQKLDLGNKTIYGETRKVPIFKDNKVIQVMTILRDKSKEKEVAELKLKNAEQKEIMLREIHHRVKNNLAIVISLLTLQIQNNSDPDLIRIMKDIELRIRSMALIHEHLYRTENLDRIPLADYLQSLTTIIMGTFSGSHINIVTRLEPTEVSIETALPIGLITNELLTNAFKYAFPDHAEGEIHILLEKIDNDQCCLTVSDNGIGLPDNYSFRDQTSLGMFIIRLLVEQLEGRIEIKNDNGASFIIHFRNQEAEKSNISIK